VSYVPGSNVRALSLLKDNVKVGQARHKPVRELLVLNSCPRCEDRHG
jgi:hypothetical protein